MAKKSGRRQPKGNAGKKVSSNKPRKTGMFKALKKHEKRAGVVGAEKSSAHNTKRKATCPKPVLNEYRNFDERMTAKHSRRPLRATSNCSAVGPPTFVMAAPTFQFNANSIQATPAPREVEGFHGFVSALDAPKDVPIGNPTQGARQSKPIERAYHGSNVFAVLDDSDDEQQQQKTQVAPAFMQPATFTLATTKPMVTVQSLLRQSIQPAAAVVSIDPDL